MLVCRIYCQRCEYPLSSVCLRCGVAIPCFDPLWDRKRPPTTPEPTEAAPEADRPKSGPPRPAWPEAKARPPV